MYLLQKYWLLIFFVLLIIFLFKFFLKPKSKTKRLEKELTTISKNESYLLQETQRLVIETHTTETRI